MSKVTSIASSAVKGQEGGKAQEAEGARHENESLLEAYRLPLVQPKLSVGAPDDPYEQEADEMADTVMRMPEQGFVQRKCAECEKEEQAQRKPLSEGISPLIQRSLRVPDELPTGLPPGDISRTIPVADKRTHFNSIIQSLCPTFEVNGTGDVASTTSPAPAPAALAGGAHPVGCCGINILVNGVNDWKIEMSQLLGPHTEPPPSATFVLPPPRSAIGFGDFSAGGGRLDLNDVVVAGHEMVGHGSEIELDIHNQGAEDRESFNHHDPTVRIQNLVQHEQGLPASQDRGLAASSVHRGESFGSVLVAEFPFNISSVASLPPAEQAKLQLAAQFILANGTWVDIVGHSDPVGSDAAKQQVSDDRANAVKARLIALGVTPRFTKRLPTYTYTDRPRFTRVAGVSDTQPPVTGADDNTNWRRVEIFMANHPAGAEVPPADVPALRPATPGASLATEQTSADACHRLLANSAFPTPAAAPAPAPAAPAAVPAAGGSNFLQRKCAECSTPTVSDDAARSIESSKGGGTSMDRDTESFMSNRFGADFRDVRIHHNSESTELNRGLQAKAFTTGKDIYFNEGQYRPDSESGKRLLAHELTHVVQQNGAGDAVQQKSDAVQRKNQTPDVQRDKLSGAGRTISALSLMEMREEKVVAMRFNAVFSDNSSGSFPILWDVGAGEEVPIGNDYLIKDEGIHFLVNNTKTGVQYSLVLTTTDKTGNTFASNSNLDNAVTTDSTAQQDINDFKTLRAALSQRAYPLQVDFIDMTGEAKDTNKGKGTIANQVPVRKPVFNYKLPEWFQQLKDKVEQKVRQDGEANKDNPLLPEKIIWYGDDIVQEKKGPDAWTIQVNKGGGMAFYTVQKKQWDDAADKDAFTAATVKILYDKVELILTRPPENDKPTYDIDGTGDGNKFKQEGSQTQANPFSGLKKEDLDKVQELLKKLTGDPKPPDKDTPPPMPLSKNDVKALLALAKDPQQDKIIAYLKAKTGNGVTSTKSIEELIALGRLKDAYERFDITPDKGADKPDPVVSRPVHGSIVQHDPLIIVNKTVSYGFEVRDDVDALRVPWIAIRWLTYPDPSSTTARQDFKKTDSIRYIPINEEGLTNRKHFKVEYPTEGVYIVEAIVDHNYFLPNLFTTNVKVQDEEKVLKEKEGKVYSGFLKDGTTSEIDFGQMSYGKGTVTKGKLADQFKGATAEEQLAEVDKEIKRIDDIITKYKDAKGSEGAAMVEWGEKYKAELQAGRDQIAKTKDDPEQHVVACTGTYVSRTLGVKTADLKMTCFVKKGQKYHAGSDEFDKGTWEDGYWIQLYDRTQLYENKTYSIPAFGATSEAAMQAAFSQLSEVYPDGHISLAFQRWDDKTDSKTDEYIKYTRVTDTRGKDIKKVLFSAPVNIAVNVIGIVLTMFPLTTGAGLAITILYNGAQTVSELAEQADKGTLTGKQVGIATGSLILDVLPGVGAVSKGARIVQVGTKAYYLFEGVQLAGQAVLMYEQGMEQVETMRKDYFIKIADLDEEIANLESTNPSSTDLDKLKKEREDLLNKGRSAVYDQIQAMATQQLLFTVGAKFLHGVHEHYSAKSKLTKVEATGKIADSLAGAEGINVDERAAIADRFYKEDVPFKTGEKSGWRKEGEGWVLEVGENATKAEIDGLLDKNPNAKPTEEPSASKGTKDEEHAADKRPTHSEEEPVTASPVDQKEETPTTATGEVHEYRVHKDGSISRCSDRCTLVVENALARAKDVQGVFGKDHANSTKAKELAKQAREIAKEAKKASAISDPETKTAKEKEVLDKATQLELDMAVLEKDAIRETKDRFTASLKGIDDFLVKYPEYREKFAQRIKNREDRMKEILPKLNDPDPTIKSEAWNELKQEGENTRKLARDMVKHSENLKKPDISKRYSFTVETNKQGDHIKVAQGELGVPGEVMKHRNETEQGKVSSGSGDDAGHLIANIFGAPGGQENLGKQNWKANEFGTWRKLEILWAEKLVGGTKVSVIIKEYAHVKGERPYKREVTWTETSPGGEVTTHEATFGNFESAKSREATGAAPTQGVPEGGGKVYILNDERAKRGLPPVYSQEELQNITKYLQTEAANDNSGPANDNSE